MPDEMLDRMTDDARMVITLARQEARGLGHHWTGAEHLLLGLLRHEDAFAARALGSLGITVEDARAQVDGLIEDSRRDEHEDRKKRAATSDVVAALSVTTACYHGNHEFTILTGRRFGAARSRKG